MQNVHAESLLALISASPHAIFDLDPEGRVIETWNDAAVRMLGWAREEVLGRPLPYVPEHALGDFRASLARLFSGETITGLQATRRRKDGTPIEVSIAAAPVRNGGGAITRVMCIIEDISGRKTQEAQLAHLGAAVDQSDVVTIFTDLHGTIEEVNTAFERVTGYTRGESLGKNPRFLKSDLQDRQFYDELWDKLRNGQLWRGRIRNRRKDGTIYTADATISPIRSADGIVTGFMALQRDITSQVERDDRLRQTQKMEALGQLTSGIAHDFNNLLTVIQANVEFLREDLVDPPADAANCLRDIATAAHRGAGMVRRLMPLSLNEQLLLESLELGSAIHDFGRTLRRIFPASIAIDVDVEEMLPSIWADPGAVEQILLNLATNARDAMPEGGRLGIRAYQSESQTIELEIRDTGTGMDEVVLRRAFEPFFTTKPVDKGTGLGMSMVYGLMQRHGGQVTIDSGLGRGTVVRLSFPIELRTPARSACAEHPGPRGGAEHILLVEDEVSVRRIGRLVLERSGYSVSEAGDGIAALNLIEERPGQFDLVVSDRVMPRMGGDDLRRELLRRKVPIRFLLTTGYPEPGTVGVLQKPWTAESLTQAIRAALAAPFISEG